MRTSAQHRIEELLLERVAAEVAARGAPVFDRAAARRSIESALEAIALAAPVEARDRTASSAASSPGTDRSRELERCIERALADGLRAAFETLELDTPPAPCVALVRADA